jgi:hypothetical protein
MMTVMPSNRNHFSKSQHYSTASSSVLSEFQCWKLSQTFEWMKAFETIWNHRLRRVARRFIFEPKIPIWVHKFWSDLDWKMLMYFMAICNILWAFGILYDHLVHFVPIWYILCPFGTFCAHLVHFFGFGIMHQEKSGNPVLASNVMVFIGAFEFECE